MNQLRTYFSKFGTVLRVKVGYSIKEDCRYGIIYFANKEAAQTVLEKVSYRVEGYDVQVNKYQERVHIDIKELNIKNKKGLKLPVYQNRQRRAVKPQNQGQPQKPTPTVTVKTNQTASEPQTSFPTDPAAIAQQPSPALNTIANRGPSSIREKTPEIIDPSNFNLSSLFRKNDGNAIFEVRLIGYLKLSQAHTSYNLRLNWGKKKGRRPRRRLGWFEKKSKDKTVKSGNQE